jgi:hypothetical protein
LPTMGVIHSCVRRVYVIEIRHHRSHYKGHKLGNIIKTDDQDIPSPPNEWTKNPLDQIAVVGKTYQSHPLESGN